VSLFDDFIDANDRVLTRRLQDTRVAMPGRIVSYDATKQVADVQPVVRDTRDVDFQATVTQLPVINSVPLVFPYGGAFRLLFKPAVGDTVLLVFCDVSIDIWAHQGGDDVDPRDGRRHELSDAIAIVGVRPSSKPWAGGDIEGVSLGKDAGTQVVIKDGYVGLGGDNLSEPVILGTTYRNAEDAYLTALTNALIAVGTALNTAGVDPKLVGLASVAAGGLASAGTALIAAANAAKTAFDLTKPNHLSNTVKVKP
jgi:hypothetical protein